MIWIALGIVLTVLSIWMFVNPRKESLLWFLTYFFGLAAGLTMIISPIVLYLEARP